MSEHYSRPNTANPEQYRQAAEEIILRVVAKGGSLSEATEAAHAIKLTSEDALRIVYALQDRQVIVMDEAFRLRLTGAGEAYILEKGIASEAIVELADIAVESKARMKQLGQQILKSTEQSY
jgi:hypothetical protein